MFSNKVFLFLYLLLSLVKAILEICLEAMKTLIRTDLIVLKTNFDTYFDDAIFNDNAPWITHAFEANLDCIADDDMYKDKLIDLQSSTALYSTFISCNGDFFKFWRGLVEGFPMLTKCPLEVIVPFPTTYLC